MEENEYLIRSVDGKARTITVTGIDGLRQFLHLIQTSWEDGNNLVMVADEVIFQPSEDRSPLQFWYEILQEVRNE